MEISSRDYNDLPMTSNGLSDNNVLGDEVSNHELVTSRPAKAKWCYFRPPGPTGAAHFWPADAPVLN